MDLLPFFKSYGIELEEGSNADFEPGPNVVRLHLDEEAMEFASNYLFGGGHSGISVAESAFKRRWMKVRWRWWECQRRVAFWWKNEVQARFSALF